MNSAWHGVLVDLAGSEVVLRDCDIVDNTGELIGGGLVVVDGNSASLYGCRLLRNSASIAGGAIYAEWNPGVQAARLLIDGCVIVGNSSTLGAALETSNAEVTMRSCTVADNTVTGNGAVLQIEGSALPTGFTLEKCIVAFNDGAALLCLGAGSAVVTCTDAFGNEDNSLCGTGSGSNLSADPLFCSRDQGDYHIALDSPCSPGNSPSGCELIGALEPICVETVLPATWGGIKGSFMGGNKR
jgi:hypothetical protein